jgi:uncharacterized protein YggT (Ycf19 family)
MGGRSEGIAAACGLAMTVGLFYGVKPDRFVKPVRFKKLICNRLAGLDFALLVVCLALQVTKFLG